VVISDYRLPQFTGLDALNLVKASGKDVPFILVSGAIGEEQAVALLKAGAHDYVLKNNLVRLPPAVARELGDAEVRRQRARQLLRDTDLPVLAIAETLGYADAPAFTRAFRRWSGTTPTAWRAARRRV